MRSLPLTVARAAHRASGKRRTVLPIRPSRFDARVVWILGAPRTGSSWLLNLLGEHPRTVLLDEPSIGVHLAPFYPETTPGLPSEFDSAVSVLPRARGANPRYFFAAGFEPIWGPPLRRLVLSRLWAHAVSTTDASDDPTLVIKEPAGSQAAELLLSVLPRSRMIFLLRDGRDAISSELDALDRGGWLTREMGVSTPELTPEQRLRALEAHAQRWLVRTDAVQRAYDQHPDAQRLLIRYEELRANPARELERTLAWLGRGVSRERAERWADKHAFENLPAAKRGKREFTRSATPGAWKDDLSEAEQQTLERLIGDRLAELGYPAVPAGAEAAR